MSFVRFALLPIGARFQYRDHAYRKVSPLEAIEDATDTRRLIPRSTQVESMDPPPRGETTQQPISQVALGSIESALDGCVRNVEHRSRSLEPPLSEGQISAVLTLVREAHAEAMAHLRPGTDTGQYGKQTGNPGAVSSLNTKPWKKGAENP